MDAKDLVVWALEASLSFSPRQSGLTSDELVELGAHFGLSADAVVDQLRGRATEDDRVLPFSVDPSFFATYDGDLRSIQAFDHVVAAFNAAAASQEDSRQVSREALVSSGVDAGLPRGDVELAVATFRAFESVPEAEDRWEVRRVKPGAALPSAQRSGPGRRLARRERYAELAALVGPLVERRGAAAKPAAAPAPAPSRPVATPAAAPSRPMPTPAAAPLPPADDLADGSEDDPLDAFRKALPGLGLGRLVAWWAQLTHDLGVAEQHGASLATCVLAATLTEAALHTACPRPKEKKVVPNAKPARWGLPEMAKAASGIGVDPILRSKIEKMVRPKQRLHVQRVLDLTGNVTDVATDEAREAGEALRETVRAVLAWHEIAAARR